jgi:hypothetical protein
VWLQGGSPPVKAHGLLRIALILALLAYLPPYKNLFSFRTTSTKVLTNSFCVSDPPMKTKEAFNILPDYP